MLYTAIALLAAAVVMVPLAHRLGAGAIVGYLAAGVLVGPHLLGVVPDAAALAGVSELGIAMLLFVIGLGLEPPRVWEMRRSVFGAGMAQVALCGAALFAAALLAGLPWQPALLVGLALAQSSTAIAMQLMTERGIIGTPTGRVAFGVHLFQDLFALPLIALVALLGQSGSAADAKPAWLMALVLAGAVVVGRVVLRPAFRLIAGSGLREVFTAASLLLVLGMAALLNWAGFSLALGAFLAGMLLADSEYRKALETDIEPFKGLLLGLFFLTVGASLDLPAIASRWPLVAGIAVGLVAVKAGILSAMAPFAGVPREGRLAFVALLAQGSEFGIVVIAAAHAAGLLTGVQASVLAPAIVLSMLFSPLALAAADRLSVRRQSAAPPHDAMPPQQAPVIIAGFGRVGQVVGRVLFSHGIGATVLDRDPQQIELLRRFGYKVFYGDATRLDLLRAAGAESSIPCARRFRGSPSWRARATSGTPSSCASGGSRCWSGRPSTPRCGWRATRSRRWVPRPTMPGSPPSASDATTSRRWTRCTSITATRSAWSVRRAPAARSSRPRCSATAPCPNASPARAGSSPLCPRPALRDVAEHARRCKQQRDREPAHPFAVRLQLDVLHR